MPTREELKILQNLPIDLKIKKTKQRIREWVEYFGEDGVYVSFSGGKDSTVLLHIVRELYPSVPAVFCDTGLEFPEIREFVKTFDNVTWLKPRMNFKRVIEEYGYPIVSKEVSKHIFEIRKRSEISGLPIQETNQYLRSFVEDSDYCKQYPHYCKAQWGFLFESDFKISHMCCVIMKKQPSYIYERKTKRKPILGTMASESKARRTAWFKEGCNSFNAKRKTSTPMAFWNESDVLRYIKQNELPICPIYGDIVEKGELTGQMNWNDYANLNVSEELETTRYKTTGCMFCGFGCHLEKTENARFLRMKKTHPKQYEYIMKPLNEGGLGFREVIDWLNENGGFQIKY